MKETMEQSAKKAREWRKETEAGGHTPRQANGQRARAVPGAVQAGEGQYLGTQKGAVGRDLFLIPVV